MYDVDKILEQFLGEKPKKDNVSMNKEGLTDAQKKAFEEIYGDKVKNMSREQLQYALQRVKDNY